MYKQLIIARRDLNMSPGKLATQVSHASMAFLISQIRQEASSLFTNRYTAIDHTRGGVALYMRQDLYHWAKEAYERGEEYFYAEPVDPENPYRELRLCSPNELYTGTLCFDKGLYEGWIDEAETKIVCGARDKSHLLKAIEQAKELDMKEGEDYFLIYDACHTELTPESDEGTLTCIGFKPMPAEIIDQIGKEYHLY